MGRRLAARLHRVPARMVAQLADLRAHARAAGAARAPADVGRRQAQLHLASTSSRCRRQAMEELLAGLVPGLPDEPRARRSWSAPRASRSTRSRRCGCCSTAGALVQEGSVYRPTGPIESLEVPGDAARADRRAPRRPARRRAARAPGRGRARQDVHEAGARRARRSCREDELRAPAHVADAQGGARRPGRPALARARPVRLPPGPAPQGRLRDALAGATARRATWPPPRTSSSAGGRATRSSRSLASHYLAAYEAAPGRGRRAADPGARPASGSRAPASGPRRSARPTRRSATSTRRRRSPTTTHGGRACSSAPARWARGPA